MHIFVLFILFIIGKANRELPYIKTLFGDIVDSYSHGDEIACLASAIQDMFHDEISMICKR